MNKLLLSIVPLFFVSACDSGGKFAGYSDQEILSGYQECLSLQSPSRIKAIACDNYERECTRRKGDNNPCAM